MTRICRQLVYVRAGHALVSGDQTLPVSWPDGMRPAWVLYRHHDGPAVAIAETRGIIEDRQRVLESVA